MDRDFIFEEGCILTGYKGNQQNITIPSNTVGIVEAFRCNTNIKLVSIDAKIIIGENAFRDCSGLGSVIFSTNSVMDIGESAFRDCTALSSIDIPDTLFIGENAFRDCTRMNEVTINGCSNIEDYAFRGCTRLSKVTINDEYVDFGYGVFAECPNVTLYVKCGSTAEKYALNNGIKYKYI
ncbi:MAG: leucine-rich repeat domain-containing protein [Oscillospiraceae bacterium]|nr:leucine-rich repeat domain-containing protein [Oscillospiraceae bacterium]